MSRSNWIPIITGRMPAVDEEGISDYILLSFANMEIPSVGQYKVDENGDGAFYLGDCPRSCSNMNLFVNAWQNLPECMSEG